MKPKHLLWTIAACLVIALAYNKISYEQGMKLCQQSHSFSTCFHTLNR